MTTHMNISCRAVTRLIAAALLCLALYAPTAARADDDNNIYSNGNSAWQMKPSYLQNNYGRPPPAPNMQDAHVRMCNATADCAAVNPPCGHLVAVNKESQQLVQNWYNYVGAKMNCIARPDDSALSPICRNRICIMAAPGAGVPDKSNPGYCQEDADCAAVTDVCKRISAVNKQNAQQTQATMNAQDPAQCQWMDKTYLTGVSCVDHICKATVSNYPPQ